MGVGGIRKSVVPHILPTLSVLPVIQTINLKEVLQGREGGLDGEERNRTLPIPSLYIPKHSASSHLKIPVLRTFPPQKLLHGSDCMIYYQIFKSL